MSSYQTKKTTDDKFILDVTFSCGHKSTVGIFNTREQAQNRGYAVKDNLCVRCQYKRAFGE